MASGLAILLGLIGCTADRTAGKGQGRPMVAPAREVHRVEWPGIENAYQLGPRLWSGGEPHGEMAFAALASAGVKVVVSVDGAAPDIEQARRHGLRYVHVPVGYDGLPAPARASLASLVEGTKEGVFVHCHHGRHRGPAAAALLARASGVWSAAEAEKWMTEAGTSPDYPGLYRSVREFEMPVSADLTAARKEQRTVVRPAGIVESMVSVDGHAEALADMKVAGWKPVPATPDETPVQVARLLAEDFKEAARLGLGPDKDEFSAAIKEAADIAAELETALRKGDVARTEAAWKQVRAGCVSCHKAWRN